MSISMGTSEPAPSTMLTTYILPHPKCDCFRNGIKLGAQIISPFKTSFCYLVHFQLQKLLKIWCLFQLRSGNYEIISIKFYSLRAFQQYCGHAQISFNFFVLILLNFQWQYYSKFNNSHIVGLNVKKPPQCTPIYQGLSNITMSPMGGALWFGRCQCNKPPFLINRYCPSN
jgi:hypothetical protein